MRRWIFETSFSHDISTKHLIHTYMFEQDSIFFFTRLYNNHDKQKRLKCEPNTRWTITTYAKFRQRCHSSKSLHPMDPLIKKWFKLSCIEAIITTRSAELTFYVDKIRQSWPQVRKIINFWYNLVKLSSSPLNNDSLVDKEIHFKNILISNVHKHPK